jgi:RNA polymerase subunit RPABC4/transcription elongation factor Spt4
MKVGNVILAIFLWLCIPASLLVSVFATLGGASATEGVICMIGAPLILFILGLVILIKGMDKPKHTTSKHEERFCPNCGRVIPLDAKMCPYCGNDFQSISKENKVKFIVKDEVEKNEGKSRKTKFCVQCGASLEGNLKFCNQCGAKLR